MKVLSVLLALLLTVAFVACGDDDDSSGTSSSSTTSSSNATGTLDPSKIYISEYFTGLNNDKYVEIFNGNTIDVATSRIILRKFNFSGTPSAYVNAKDIRLDDAQGYAAGVTPPSKIEAGKAIVLVSLDATPEKRGIPHAISVGYAVAAYNNAIDATQIVNFNGDDGLAILVDNVVVDIMGKEEGSGYGFVSPDYNQTGATGVYAAPYKNRVLQYTKMIRKPGKKASTTPWATVLPDSTVWDVKRWLDKSNGVFDFVTNASFPTGGYVYVGSNDHSTTAGAHTP